MEIGGLSDVVCFDKTGTLTHSVVRYSSMVFMQSHKPIQQDLMMYLTHITRGFGVNLYGEHGVDHNTMFSTVQWHKPVRCLAIEMLRSLYCAAVVLVQVCRSSVACWLPSVALLPNLSLCCTG